MLRRKIAVNDKMQSEYSYYPVELEGENFDPEFKPELTPKQMLALGVFGGKVHDRLRERAPKGLVYESETLSRTT